MYEAQIHLYPGNAGREIETETLRLYLLIQDQTPSEQQEFVRMVADHDSGWILVDDCDPEMIVQCVDAFTEAIADAGREIKTHLHISQDRTLDKFV